MVFKLRTKIEEAGAKKIENKLEEIHRKAKINPNIIWDARKRAKGSNGLDYRAYTEEGEQITDPIKTKEHVANYFEGLYQAREGKVEYISMDGKDISTREKNPRRSRK